MPQINFDWDFVSAIHEVLPNYIPSFIYNTPQIVDDMLLSPGEWILMSPNNKEMLIFHVQKIDFITINVGDTYSKEIIHRFTEICENIFGKILAIKGIKAKRLAIAPTFRYMGDETSYKDFVKNIFAKNKFNNSIVDNCDFSQVFRVDEKINKEIYKINYLSKFYIVSSVVSDNGANKIQEVKLIDFDINTFANSQYSFNASAVKDFFAKAPNFCFKFMKWYWGEE